MFEEKEIYHLTLQDVAVELGTNRTHISTCINKYFGCNFRQMLIHYRIGAAKELLRNSELGERNRLQQPQLVLQGVPGKRVRRHFASRMAETATTPNR